MYSITKGTPFHNVLHHKRYPISQCVPCTHPISQGTPSHKAPHLIRYTISQGTPSHKVHHLHLTMHTITSHKAPHRTRNSITKGTPFHNALHLPRPISCTMRPMHPPHLTRYPISQGTPSHKVPHLIRYPPSPSHSAHHHISQGTHPISQGTPSQKVPHLIRYPPSPSHNVPHLTRHPISQGTPSYLLSISQCTTGQQEVTPGPQCYSQRYTYGSACDLIMPKSCSTKFTHCVRQEGGGSPWDLPFQTSEER